jgi:hypothetical protein
MQLKGSFVDTEEIISPISAIVIAKGIDNKGVQRYGLMYTDDDDWVANAGLMAFGSKAAELYLTHMVIEMSGDEEEDED